MKSGGFSLELVNVETKEPMKEFNAPDGKVYVEAEPDLEYFIRCHRDQKIGGQPISVKLEVDGTRLGYSISFAEKSGDMGLWKRQNGVETMAALKFVLKQTRGVAAGSTTSAMPPLGSVKALFYETLYSNEMAEQRDCDTTNCLNANQSSAPAVASGAKKAFASVSGSATSSTNIKQEKWCRKTKLGRLLGEMTIHYTSALGLFQLGILGPNDEDDAGTDEPANGIAPNAAATPSSTSSNGANNANDDGSTAGVQPKRERIKTEPVTSSNSDGASSDPRPKRVKTEPARAASVPRPAASSGNVIDLTSNALPHAAPTDNFIDLTGDD